MAQDELREGGRVVVEAVMSQAGTVHFILRTGSALTVKQPNDLVSSVFGGGSGQGRGVGVGLFIS